MIYDDDMSFYDEWPDNIVHDSAFDSKMNSLTKEMHIFVIRDSKQAHKFCLDIR